jgi:hypothetical protein
VRIGQAQTLCPAGSRIHGVPGKSKIVLKETQDEWLVIHHENLRKVLGH